MPRYARAVIPGRPSDGRDLDRLVFGDQHQGYDELGGEEEEYEEEAEEEEDVGFVERSRRDRRSGRGRRRNDYAALPDDEGGYEREPSNGRGLFLLAGILVICGVFGAVVWNAYSGGIRPAEASTAPMLRAEGPIKTRPARSEAPIPSALNADVFDRIEETPRVREPVEEVAAKPEPKPEPVEMAEAPKPVERPTPAPEKVEAAKPEPAPAKPEPVVTREAVNAPTPLKAPAAEPAAEPKPEAPAQLAGAYTPKFVLGAAHLVQVGATDTLTKADEEFSRLAKLAPDLFAGAERVVLPVQVDGKQMYRVRVGSFASAEDANAFCSAYKARVGDCYRATR